MRLLQVSGSPHIHAKESTQKIMWTVIIALVPTLAFSIIYFGWDAARVAAISVLACVLLEWIFQKFFLREKTHIADGSAIITGLLLAFNVPSSLPVGIIIIGAAVSIGIGKMVFGGLGKNPFNPALVGRVFLFISFPRQMTNWQLPSHAFFGTDAVSGAVTADAITGATPLALIKQAQKAGQDVSQLLEQLPTHFQFLMGDRGGSLGEAAAIAIVLGGIFMLVRKVISWHIPVAFIGTVFVFAAVLHWMNPSLYITPEYHILAGGLLLGAIFMATDMVTSPMNNWGKIVFGIGCGLLTIIFRVWGRYPEGVSFAILIMNAFVPLINKGFKPKRFGSKTM